MLEIKSVIRPAQPAVPERMECYRVETDGFAITWDCQPPCGIHIYVPNFTKAAPTTDDLRKAGQLLIQIANELDGEEEQRDGNQL